MGRDGAIRDLLGDTLVPIPVFLHIMWSLGRDVPVQLRKPTLNQFLRGCWCCFYGRRHPDLCSSSMDDSAVCEMRNAIITNKDRRSAKISVNVTGTLLLKLRARARPSMALHCPPPFGQCSDLTWCRTVQDVLWATLPHLPPRLYLDVFGWLSSRRQEVLALGLFSVFGGRCHQPVCTVTVRRYPGLVNKPIDQ